MKQTINNYILTKKNNLNFIDVRYKINYPAVEQQNMKIANTLGKNKATQRVGEFDPAKRLNYCNPINFF